jgi:septum site-determining protein MinC
LRFSPRQKSGKDKITKILVQVIKSNCMSNPENMTSESTITNSDPKPEEKTTPNPEKPVSDPCTSPVRLKKEGDQISLILPPIDSKTETVDWSETWQELQHYLKSIESFWQPKTLVNLKSSDRLLDTRQIQAIAEALQEANLQLESISTRRRQTAIAAVTLGYSVTQQTQVKPLFLAEETKTETETETLSEEKPKLDHPLYLQNTVRSGVEIRHPGTVIILGDLNPGGTVIAAGDIFVWGRLRGVAHAGAQGNRQSRIIAIQMQPTQIRIADLLARAPEQQPSQFEPEIAYITPDGIRLAKAIDFAKTHSFSEQVAAWTNDLNKEQNYF